MAVNFKNLPSAQGSAPDKTFAHLQELVASLLKSGDQCQIRVGMTETQVVRDGVKITLPFGIPQIKKGGEVFHPDMHKARKTLLNMIQPDPQMHSSASGPSYDPNASVPIPAQPVPYDDMTDQQWMEHTAGTLFPGTIHLHQATDLYQPVLGTSGGSIYKTCFIGPELKIACRIKASSISFRVTTDKDVAPTGSVLSVFGRLGAFTPYPNRLTTHANMGGPYNLEYSHEYRAVFGAYYAALKPWITSNFPAIGKLTSGVK